MVHNIWGLIQYLAVLYFGFHIIQIQDLRHHCYEVPFMASCLYVCLLGTVVNQPKVSKSAMTLNDAS